MYSNVFLLKKYNFLYFFNYFMLYLYIESSDYMKVLIFVLIYILSAFIYSTLFVSHKRDEEKIRNIRP